MLYNKYQEYFKSQIEDKKKSIMELCFNKNKVSIEGTFLASLRDALIKGIRHISMFKTRLLQKNNLHFARFFSRFCRLSQNYNLGTLEKKNASFHNSRTLLRILQSSLIDTLLEKCKIPILPLWKILKIVKIKNFADDIAKFQNLQFKGIASLEI